MARLLSQDLAQDRSRRLLRLPVAHQKLGPGHAGRVAVGSGHQLFRQLAHQSLQSRPVSQRSVHVQERLPDLAVQGMQSAQVLEQASCGRSAVRVLGGGTGHLPHHGRIVVYKSHRE